MSADQIDVLCAHCGQALSAFLHEMAERNAKVVCLNCGESRDDAQEKPEGLPAESGRPSSGSTSSGSTSS